MLKGMRILGLFFGLCLCLSPLAAKAGPPSDEDLVKLVHASGGNMIVEQMSGLMSKALYGQLKRQNPGIPDQVADIMTEEFSLEFAKNKDEMIREIAMLWKPFLTQSDVDSLLDLLNAPAMKKMFAAQPEVMKRSNLVGQKFGQKLAQNAMPRVMERIKALGQ